MSRHSHWAKIKRAKGAEDAKRGAAFTKLSRTITMAAREKGSDPAMNFKLRLAIDAARAENMPKDTIERAVARASGSGEGGELAEVTYEAFGPGGIALLIEAVTDNKNRTSGNVKTILSKYGGSLAGPGAVKWQFDTKGVIRIAKENVGDLPHMELELIDRGAEDVREEDGGLTIYTMPDNLQRMSDFLVTKNITLEYSGIEWVPKNTVAVSDPGVRAALDLLYEAIDADEDVATYATNEA
ncbi:YebC/PmpR family DNA-binding transcriptional regulator [Candidatus Uhrbacteria bacterium]|nr:YebC/PmpR family DNA-binding transcriptional regulator [Candidatus Uhrbacteria bacterium]